MLALRCEARGRLAVPRISLSPHLPELCRMCTFPRLGIAQRTRDDGEDRWHGLDANGNFILSMSHVRFELRTLRRKSGLSQEELATLLPRAGRTKVVRIEDGTSRPDAAQILACELIFGSPSRELFKRLFADTEEAVMQAAYVLHSRLERDTSVASQRKREFLESILDRVTKGSKRDGA